jgi:glucose-1-phosphate thymidylyltransferase
MVYYPLSVLMLAGIQEILIISTPHDLPRFQELLGDGAQFGLRLAYAPQPRPDGLAQALIIANDFLGGAPSALILGDNLFYGHDFAKILERADAHPRGACIFGYQVNNPNAYGVVEFDPAGKVLSIEEKPTQPRSHYAVPGLYFYDAQAPALAAALRPSARGELEITDLNRCYLERGELHVELLGRGTAWLDTGTHDSLLEAGTFVQIIERRQGLKICCPEEIAFRAGWIGSAALGQQIARLGKSSYGEYLKTLLT